MCFRVGVKTANDATCSPLFYVNQIPPNQVRNPGYQVLPDKPFLKLYPKVSILSIIHKACFNILNFCCEVKRTSVIVVIPCLGRIL